MAERAAKIRQLEHLQRNWMTFEQWRVLNPNASPLAVEIAAKMHPWVNELLARQRAGERA